VRVNQKFPSTNEVSLDGIQGQVAAVESVKIDKAWQALDFIRREPTNARRCVRGRQNQGGLPGGGVEWITMTREGLTRENLCAIKKMSHE